MHPAVCRLLFPSKFSTLQSAMTSVVLITGASSGIGEALALAYARRGADLVLLARREERLRGVAERVKALGRQALFVRCDVTRDEDLRAAVEQALTRFGRLDVVIANAGFGIGGRVERLSIDDYRRVFDTNVFGVIRTVHATLDALKRSHGRLAILGSVAGYVAAPGMSPYAMSKFAVRAFSHSLRGELRSDGVSVTLVSPGFVDSEIRKIDRSGVYREEAPDPVPAWLRMPTPRAARQIVRAIDRRRPEIIVTAHGKLMVFFVRHTPRTLHALVRVFTPRVRKPDR
jgi:short-subunit dehydrogenase